MKTSIAVILSTISLLFSCTKSDNNTEKPKWEKCSVFSLSTKSGHYFKLTKMKDHSSYFWDMQYLKFNTDSIVIDTVRMLLDKGDMDKLVYKQECFPSYIN
jgi:hypothetical protein